MYFFCPLNTNNSFLQQIIIIPDTYSKGQLVHLYWNKKGREQGDQP